MPRTPLLLVAGLLSIAAGCAPKDMRLPPPEGHPARADAPQVAPWRSETLRHADPVQTEPARSEHWARRAEQHEDHEDREGPEGRDHDHEPDGAHHEPHEH